MSYESDCNDYAVHGDPERDHYDYEENAVFDQFDGFDDGIDYAGDAADNEPCPVCAVEGNCVGCKAAADWLAAEEQADSNDCEVVPF